MSAMQWPFAERFRGQEAEVDNQTSRTTSAAALVSVLGVLIVHFTSVRVLSIWLPVAILLAAAITLFAINARLEKGQRVNIRSARSAAVLSLLAALLPGLSLTLGPTAFVGVWLVVSGAFGARISAFGRTFPSTIPGFLIILVGALVHTYSLEATIRTLWFFD